MSQPIETILRWFPRMTADDFEITSPQDGKYNCIAWAAGDESRWWEPSLYGGHFWPPGLITGAGAYTIDNYVAAFESIGYQRTPDGNHQPGWERVAVYLNPPKGFHAARQVADGQWISKLGQSFDIRHVNVECLTGSAYGEVRVFLRRAAT